MEAYDRLVKLVQDAAEEVSKAEGGNKAAGTRVRKAMQEVKQTAQEVRVAILGAPPAPTGTGPGGRPIARHAQPRVEAIYASGDPLKYPIRIRTTAESR